MRILLFFFSLNFLIGLDCKGEDLPPLVQNAKSAYEKRRDDGLRRLDEEYAKELQRFRVQYTKVGDLRSALAIEEEIKRVEARLDASVIAAEDQPALQDFAKKLISNGASTAKFEDGKIEISGKGFVYLDELIKPPFKLTVKIIPSGEVRIYYSEDQKAAMICNWSSDPKQLRYHEYIPGKEKGAGVKEKGFLELGKSHVIVWNFRKDGVRVSADGRTVLRFTPQIKNLVGKIGIGSFHGFHHSNRRMET